MSFDKPQKTDCPIEGVKCTVDNCFYNSCDCGCTASMIEVSNSRTGSKTDCETFTPKKDGCGHCK